VGGSVVSMTTDARACTVCETPRGVGAPSAAEQYACGEQWFAEGFLDELPCAVELIGLVSRPDLNGRHGWALEKAEEPGRIHVVVDGPRSEALALKPVNLQPPITSIGWLYESSIVARVDALACASVDGDVPAQGFADVCMVLIKILELIPATSLASSDMMVNATTLRDLAANAPAVTIQQLVSANPAHANGKKAESVTVWLVRAIKFIMKLLRELSASRRTLHECLEVSYEASLKSHHSFMVQMAIGVAFAAAPSREEFVALLGPSEPVVLASLRPLLTQVERLIESCETAIRNRNR